MRGLAPLCVSGGSKLKIAALSFSAAFALLTAAPAFGADKVISSFDEQTLKNVLAAVGATELEAGSAGDDSFTAFTVNKVRYAAALRRCTSGKCEGIIVQCTWRGENYASATANSFNLAHTFPTAVVSEDSQTLMLARYTVAAGGVTEAHVAEVFQVFFLLPPMLAEQVRGARVASAPAQTAPASISTALVATADSVETTPGVAAQPPSRSEMFLPIGSKFTNKMTP